MSDHLPNDSRYPLISFFLFLAQYTDPFIPVLHRLLWSTRPLSSFFPGLGGGIECKLSCFYPYQRKTTLLPFGACVSGMHCCASDYPADLYSPWLVWNYMAYISRV